ncbi:MAG: methyltransferase domain-containing protein [Sphingomonadales bacterium]|nr:methyltransferase domain-containing protein [Sphingomonadales bacterium]
MTNANPPEIFDRRLLGLRRARAARAFGAHDFLFREVAGRLIERLQEVNRRFEAVLEIGGGRGGMAEELDAGWAVRTELTAGFGGEGPLVVADEEWLPFAQASFDLVISNLALHWVNDLVGALIQANHALRPDGLLLVAMLGGETLKELRQALLQAESEVSDGARPRVSPFADIRDLGSLLQRAGFAMPVVDADTITVTYPDAFALMRDLRGMGEASALIDRPRRLTGRAVLFRAAEIYRDRFADADGRIPATFQVLTLTGWAPAAGQPKPLRPGSATARLADALGTKEISAGEKAGR